MRSAKRTGFCKTHPTYQARRPPTTGCVPCQRAFDAHNGVPRPGSLRKYLARSFRPHEQAIVNRASDWIRYLALMAAGDVEIWIDNPKKTGGYAVCATHGPDGITIKSERFIKSEYGRKLGLV